VKLLGVTLLLGGYTLVYAAVAAGGIFAGAPWLRLMFDAYGAREALKAHKGHKKGP
jgi:hypothetical protein